jgi:ribose 5-phosphate isomerase B
MYIQTLEGQMIAIASDHAGYELKSIIIEYLKEKGIDVSDLGTHDAIASVDYPDYGEIVGKAVSSDEAEKGIIICGTGIGISLAANKVNGIRAAVCTNEYMARLTRQDNNANVLALGARVIGSGLALSIVDTFLNTDFAGDDTRHGSRVSKIMNIEKNNL